jgi:hypothetical protein
MVELEYVWMGLTAVDARVGGEVTTEEGLGLLPTSPLPSPALFAVEASALPKVLTKALAAPRLVPVA